MPVEASREHRLIAERAYFSLRDRIVTLKLPPGAPLREEELMRDLGIGRTPLREAVKRLELEDLVAVQPRRGTRVTEVEVADIVHITELRAELEGTAAELAARRLDGGARTRADELMLELQGMGPAPDAMMRVDEAVHRLVWETCGNPYMSAVLERLFALSLRIWHLVLDRVPGLAASVHDQRLLLDALLAGHGARARTLMRDHVLAFQREVLAAFAS
jgi:DNA-binding GntR family transcriptional regulator